MKFVSIKQIYHMMSQRYLNVTLSVAMWDYSCMLTIAWIFVMILEKYGVPIWSFKEDKFYNSNYKCKQK